jgi:surface protein
MHTSNNRRFTDFLETVRRSVVGAIDLASIMVGVIVLGVIGGVIAATVFAVIPWAQDNAARGNLSAVRDAQSVARAQEGAYLSVPELVERGYLPAASEATAGSGAYGVSPASYMAAAAVDPVVVGTLVGTVDETGGCYLVASQSETGKTFFTTSETNDILLYEKGETVSDCGDIATLSDVLEPAKAVFSSSAFGNGMIGETYTQTVELDSFSDYTMWVSSGSIPVGLTLNETTGVISGVPTEIKDRGFEVTARNRAGIVVTSVSIIVVPRAVMVSTWDTSISGCTTITLPMFSSAEGTVDWGDGTVEASDIAATHTYTGTPGVKTVKVIGKFYGWGSMSATVSATAKCLTGVNEWVGTNTTLLNNAFRGAVNLTKVAETPSGVSSMLSMFEGATKFNGSVAGFRTSTVSNMSRMFNDARVFNQSLATFNTANVTNMSGMFRYAYAFNQPVNSFITANVTDMSEMFVGTNTFNQPLTGFDTSKVTNMSSMFSSARAFNQSLATFNTANVANMSGMFSAASAFNQTVSFNTANVTNMNSMFSGADVFNQSLATFNTSNVTDMSGMFSYAGAFNKPFSSTFTTAKVTDMSYMFQYAYSFNQSLGTFRTSNVTNMSYMFADAMWFNQTLSAFDTSKVTNMSYMFTGTWFDYSLSTFNTSKVTNMNGMFANNTSYNRSLTSWNTAAVTTWSNFRTSNSVLSNANTPVKFR